MRLRALRHPLLVLSYQENKREVIAQDINLDKSSRILLISGPNAGGKSVALKNVGLNQYMMQAGILPCCKADSEFSVFKNLFLDIGDEQSIDNDLSTYSSHLKNMGVMLKEADEQSLIFIDEFGSGTDPSFGGAIAEAVLGKLVSRGCFGIITTHFSNLKVYADKTEGMVNAAMVFDIDQLKPLYQLETGRPGSSFSLEVALQVGLPKDVIKLAEEGVGTSQIDIEKLLNKLEAEKQQYTEQNIKLARKEEDLARLRKEYSELKSKLEEGKKDIINQAREEAEIILSRTNKEIEKTIRHIKENRAEKKETKKIRNSLKEFSKKVSVKDYPEKSIPVNTVTDPVKSGDQALLISKEVVVDVVEIMGKKAKVLIGELQSVVALNNLKKISNRKVKEKRKQQLRRSVGYEVNEKMAKFSSTLDVRGTRASDLLQKINQFLDEAIMLNQPSLKIIHGRGNGVLRELVQEELKHWQQVASYEYEHEERGGDGSTLIKMK
jgi:DNA mismatch repair protein MutS2